MAGIRTLVISQLLPLLEEDPAHQLHLAKKYEIQDWVRSAAEKLIRRNKPLGEREFEMLDQQIVLKIASVRECCYPVFRDSDNQYGTVYDEDTTINRWEIHQERGEANVDLSTFNFSCPVPPSLAEGEQTVLESDGPRRSGEFYFEKAVFKVSLTRNKVPNPP